MKLDIGGTFDSIIDGTKEVAEVAHKKTSELHENYVSKVLPDCGKYGDAATFIAEMVPGVSEYNAIKDGDWQAFAIAAGIDVAALAATVVTFGPGGVVVKGGSSVAKAGVKKATKEVAEAGTKKIVKEVAEEGAEKTVKEVAEAGTEKIMKEVAEAGAEKTVKEVAEVGTEKVMKEAAETGTDKAIKEVVESGVEKTAKEVIETGIEKADNVICRYLECKNKGLAGDRHPITGVEFVEKIVGDGKGELVKGVFAKFESGFDAKLPCELFEESNFKQFKEANRQLLESIDNNPSLRKKFSAEQVEQIKDGIIDGRAPDGFVWHHNEEAGILQLVDQEIHELTGHTGGRAIWGGGY